MIWFEFQLVLRNFTAIISEQIQMSFILIPIIEKALEVSFPLGLSIVFNVS